MSHPGYYSAFGGLWTDRLDAEEELARRIEAGGLSAGDADLLTDWLSDGYVIIPGAVDPRVIDRVLNDLERVWNEGDPRILVALSTSRSARVSSPDYVATKHKLLDTHAYFRSVLDAIFAPVIARFLRLVFEHHPICTQTLGFRLGSEQGMHRDTAYVVMNEPLKLAASWIALEDIHPGSGALQFIHGGHRLPEYRFSGEYKHWKVGRDPAEDHDRQYELMIEEAAKRGLPTKQFIAKRGDVLIWAADLPHGGSPVTDPTLTRKSLVAHYCPEGCHPNFFEHSPERRTIREAAPRCYYASWYYNLAELPEPV